MASRSADDIWAMFKTRSKPSTAVRSDVHALLYEYACQEGNYGMTGVMSGARYEERMEAQGSSDSRRD